MNSNPFYVLLNPILLDMTSKFGVSINEVVDDNSQHVDSLIVVAFNVSDMGTPARAHGIGTPGSYSG
jgi:hypothetical protein